MNDHDTREEPHLSDRRRSADRLSRRAWLSAVVVGWGGQAIVTQSLLLREAIVLMFGSEFAWGVVLFAWLFGVAVGAALGGWMAERLPRPEVGLVTVLLALSVAACVELWLFRGRRQTKTPARDAGQHDAGRHGVHRLGPCSRGGGAGSVARR